MNDIIYGNAMHVDQRFAASFAPNLYAEAWMVPNVTFSTQYQNGAAGGYVVRKYQKEDNIKPGTPGRGFDIEKEAKDSLIPIALNNNFMTSRRLYGVTMNAIEASAAEELLADTTKLVRTSINGSGLAALTNESTALTDKGAVDKDSIKDAIMEARAELSKKGAGSAKVILASPETYSAFLAAAGKDFVTARNDIIQGTGVISDWYGFTIVEAPQLGTASSFFFNDYAGTEKEVAAATLNNINFVMYDYRAFSALTNLEVFRLIDGGIHFNGVLAQAEVNMGYRVTNPELVYKSLKA